MIYRTKLLRLTSRALCVTALAILVIAPSTRAETTAKAETSTDLDAEISDIRLRANSGAKSKFSSSLFLNYAGASFNKPFGDSRPNPGGARLAEPVSTAGNVGLRYRMNKNESFYFATGFYQARPMHSRSKDQQLEVSTPQISYNATLGLDELQVSNGMQLYITTQDYQRETGDLGSLGYTISTLSNFVQSRWSGGVGMLFRVSAFDKSEDELKRLQSDYGFTFTPTLQFNQSQRWNYFTALNLMSYSHYRSELSFKMSSNRISQSLGVGMALRRDFYLAPNLTFEPENISARATAVNLSATVNL